MPYMFVVNINLAMRWVLNNIVFISQKVLKFKLGHSHMYILQL
jgi:hypothetical protein